MTGVYGRKIIRWKNSHLGANGQSKCGIEGKGFSWLRKSPASQTSARMREKDEVLDIKVCHQHHLVLYS